MDGLGAPRIIYLCLDPGVSLEPGQGSSVHAVSMVEAMRALGAEVVPIGHADLLARAPGGAATVSAERALAAVPKGRGYARVLAREALERPRLAAAVRLALAAYPADLVYERASLASDLSGRAAVAAGLPLVLEVNAPLAREGARFRHERLPALAARHEYRAWRLARRVCAVSRDLVHQVGAAGQSDVVHVPNAVDHARFHPGVAPDAALRARTAGTFAVAFAGTLKPWHDLDTVVRAIADLRRERPVTLVLVGDGPGRVGVERLAEELAVPVVATGAVAHERVPALVAAADACVAPLHADPGLQYFSPLKAMEYLALGRPAVVADAGDLGALVRSGAALGYAPGSAPALAAALARIAAAPAVAADLVARGAELAREQSWERVARRSLAGLVALREEAAV